MLTDIFISKFVEWITSSPYLMILIAIMYLSGHIWVYIVFTYCSKKERKLLNSIVGRLVLGLLWIALILIPTYIITYKSTTIEWEYFTDILSTAVVLALAIQAVIFGLINFLCRREQDKQCEK